MNSLQELLNPVYEVGAWGLELAFYAMFFAALLAAIALAINILFRRWITAGQMNLLWGLVLVRLMLPIAPPSSFSLQGAVAKLFDGSTEVANESTAIEEWSSSPRTKTTVYQDEETGKPVYSTADELQETTSATQNSSVAASHDSLWIEDAISAILFQFLLVWPCAAVAIIAWTIFVNFRFSWRVNRTAFCRDERLATLWTACCLQAKVRRTIPIVLLDKLQQPAMMGVVHHRLLLPHDAMQLSDDELRMVMLHELAHVRRWDIAINWALVFIRAVQWWNPVYWLAASRFAATREQACDAFVIRHTVGTSGRNYGELLLKLAEKIPGRSRWRVLVPTPILGFMLSAFRRRAIAARLRALPRAAILRSRWHTVAIAVFTVLLGYAGLTDAKTASDEAADEAALDKSKSIFPATFEHADVMPEEKLAKDEPIVSRDYEVEGVLRKIAGQRYSLDEAKKMLAATVEQHVAPLDHPECKFNGDMMVVVAKESIHQELQQNLLAWEKSGLEQISIECRFITFRPEHFSRINIPWRYLANTPNLRVAENGFRPNAGSDASMPHLPQASDQPGFRANIQYEESMPLIYSMLNPKHTEYVMTRSQGGRYMKILYAPKVTLFNGTRGLLADITQRPFVVGVNPIVGDLATALQPQIAIADEGSKIFLRPVLSADHKRIQLNSRIEFSDVEAVKTASILVPHPEHSGEATIQVPQMRRLSVDICAEIENGHSLMLGSLQGADKRSKNAANMFVLLTPRLISDDGDAAQ
jgi:bla regulator protein blaR1